jgi:hypothetical protein
LERPAKPAQQAAKNPGGTSDKRFDRRTFLGQY